jgi:nicotinamidase-related amidase
MSSPTPTCLLLIDIQEGVAPSQPHTSIRSTPTFEQNITTLLSHFRHAQSSQTENPHLIIHIRHISTDANSTLHASKPEGIAFLPFAQSLETETVVTKNTSSAFVGTNLQALLTEKGVQRIVVVGTSTPHCVSSTVRSAADLRVVEHAYGSGELDIGHALKNRICVVGDATAVWWGGGEEEEMQRWAIEALRGEFCDVVSTRDVLEMV